MFSNLAFLLLFFVIIVQELTHQLIYHSFNVQSSYDFAILIKLVFSICVCFTVFGVSNDFDNSPLVLVYIYIYFFLLFIFYFFLLVNE